MGRGVRVDRRSYFFILFFGLSLKIFGIEENDASVAICCHFNFTVVIADTLCTSARTV